MKMILFAGLMFLSLNGFAQSADYTCDIRRYRLEVSLTDSISTSMWLTDTDNHHTVAQGYAKTISRKDGKTIFSFYPGQADPMKLTFKSQDVIDLPSEIQGSIDTMAGGFILREKITCYRD